MCSKRSPKALKGTEGVVNRWMNRDHPNHSFVEIGQNTEKSSTDQRGLAIIPVRPSANAGVKKNSQEIKR